MANCAEMPATLLEAFASAIKKDSDGNTFFNVICYNVDCDDMLSALDCGQNADEAFIVANGFGVDSCGNLAIKLRVCVDADAENRAL
jgi:hypothetical protein